MRRFHKTWNSPRKTVVKTAILTVWLVVLIHGICGFVYSQDTKNPKDILIIVNKSVEIRSLTIDQVREYYLKRRVSWFGGGKAIPVNAKESTELREEFRRRVLNMDRVQEERYWQDENVRRAVSPPPSFNNTIKAVFKLKGSVGYIYRENYMDDVVKIVAVIPAGG